MSDWPSNWRSDTAHGPRIDGMGRSELEQEVYAARRRAALDVHTAATLEMIDAVLGEDTDE